MADRFIKLVRDWVGNDRDKVVYGRFQGDEDDFWALLRDKLVEEAQEYQKSTEFSELIDVYEALWALCEYHRTSMTYLAERAAEERIKRGSFLNRMALFIRREDV